MFHQATPCLSFVLFAAAGLAADAPIVIRDVSIVDVERGRIVPHQDVVVAEDRISQLRPTDVSTDLSLPAGATVIDGSNRFLMPGLFDAHVHYTAGGETYGAMLIANGVTFVRDMGATTVTAVETRRALAEQDELGPEMIVTGAIVDGDPPVWPFSEPCAGPSRTRSAIGRLHAAGVDQIKVYSRLQPEDYRAAIDEAHRLRLKAVGHVPDGLTIEDAIAAGQDCVEHLSGFDAWIGEVLANEGDAPTARTFGHWFHTPNVDRDLIRDLARRIRAAGMAHCPTLAVMVGIGRADDESRQDPDMMQYVPAHLISFWRSGSYAGFAPYARQAVPHMQTFVAELHRAGVTLLVGTDLANPFVYAGFAVHEEMSLLQGAGIPPRDVLAAATIAPARFFGVSDRLGTIAAGKTASMILTRENPLSDVGNASTIEGVFHRGRYYDRAALDAMLESVRSAITEPAPEELRDSRGPAALERSNGDVIAEGRLLQKFMTFPAGHEQFTLSKVPAGYRLDVESRSRGGPQKPFDLTVLYDDDHGFVSAAYTEISGGKPIVASYVRDGSHVRVVARRGDEELEPQDLAVAPDATFSPPVFSGEAFTIRRVDLPVGGRTTVEAVGFGFPDWRVAVTPVEIERLPDAEVTGASGAWTARVFVTRVETPMGQVETTLWTDDRSIVQKVKLTFPMGELHAELESRS